MTTDQTQAAKTQPAGDTQAHDKVAEVAKPTTTQNPKLVNEAYSDYRPGGTAGPFNNASDAASPAGRESSWSGDINSNSPYEAKPGADGSRFGLSNGTNTENSQPYLDIQHGSLANQGWDGTAAGTLGLAPRDSDAYRSQFGDSAPQVTQAGNETTTAGDGKSVTTDKNGDVTTADLKSGEITSESGDGKFSFTRQPDGTSTFTDNANGQQVTRAADGSYEMKEPNGTEQQISGKEVKTLLPGIKINQLEGDVSHGMTAARAAAADATTPSATAGSDGMMYMTANGRQGAFLGKDREAKIQTNEGELKIKDGDVTLKDKNGQKYDTTLADLPQFVQQHQIQMPKDFNVQPGPDGKGYVIKYAGNTITEGGGKTTLQTVDKQNMVSDGSTVSSAVQQPGAQPTDGGPPPPPLANLSVGADGCSHLQQPDGMETTINPNVANSLQITDGSGQSLINANLDANTLSASDSMVFNNAGAQFGWSGDTVNFDGSVSLADGSTMDGTQLIAAATSVDGGDDTNSSDTPDGQYSSNSTSGGYVGDSPSAPSQIVSSVDTSVADIAAKAASGGLTTGDIGQLQAALGQLSGSITASMNAGDMVAVGQLMNAQALASSAMATAESHGKDKDKDK